MALNEINLFYDIIFFLFLPFIYKLNRNQPRQKCVICILLEGKL